MLKSVKLILTALAVCGATCCVSNVHAMKKQALQDQAQSQVTVPEFVENTRPFLNSSRQEPIQQYLWVNNYKALETIFQKDREAVRLEMSRRVQDESYPRRLRNLAAVVLVVRNDEVGRNYFRGHLQEIDAGIVDAYWILGWYAQYGTRETEEYPDMSWAEDLMIEALQDKRMLSRDEICRCHMIEEQKLVEVRELAASVGKFPAVLARMKSSKGLHVILSVIKENPPFASDFVDVLGKYGDKSVEPLILQILSKHDDRFASAIQAAVDLKMKSAVPILLKHVNDEEGSSFYGLDNLADASILPTLRRKLPTLNSDQKADARMLIIKLQAGDQVPDLLALLRDPRFLHRMDVIFRLEELKDKRAVSDLTNVLCRDDEDSMRIFALRALATIGGAEAIEGLIKGLDADYYNVKGFKRSPEHNFKAEIQGEIVDKLKKLTSQDFGTDSQKWRKWLAENRGAT